MAKKTIQIKCTGSTEFALVELNELQGELKERTPEAMKKLRKSILKHGFIAPFFIWENPETAQLQLLDGHSRKHVLNELKEDGYVMPQFPVVFIDAEDINDAKAKLLAISSQYGKFTQGGVKGFLEGFEFNTEDLLESIDIPFLDLTAGILEPDEESQIVDVSSHTREIKNTNKEVDLNEFQEFQHKCPGCGLEFNK